LVFRQTGLKPGDLKTAKVAACCALAFSLIGTARKPVPGRVPIPLLFTENVSARRAPLLAQLRQTAGIYGLGQYGDAADRFGSLRGAALEAGDVYVAARATGNLGACQFALHEYDPALRSFLEAHRLADRAGDASYTAVLDVNIASLYSEMGEPEAAAQWIEGSLSRMSGEDRRQHLPKLLIQLAIVRARQDRMPEASELFRRGTEAADRAGDLELYALGWNRLGEELLKRGSLAQAETALLEAFRVRKLHRLDLELSYRNLGRLRLAQGDLASASALLDRAVELADRPFPPLPAWDVYHSRGRVRLAQGRLREALDDLRIAARLARAWRWSAPAYDAANTGAEGMIEQVYSALVEAGNRLYLETGDAALIRETFEAEEENRAGSLREILFGRRADAANVAASGVALERLQREEAQALRTRDARAQDAVRATRAEIVRAQALPEASPHSATTGLLERTRAALDSHTALLSFHLGDSVSWMWALDRDGLALHVLPPRQRIESQIQAATRAIREDSTESGPAGANLYRTLFGPLDARFRRRTRWLLALDEGLFDVPVAALLESTRPRPVYVAERRATVVIPGAGYWLETATRPTAGQPSPVFLGVGDPIYNGADPRLPHRRENAATGWLSPLRLFTASPPRAAAGLVLPRLVASGEELEDCARAWDGETILLRGAGATRRNLAEQMRRHPAVVHFATHVLESAERPACGLIALSLTDRQEAELLTPFEIAHWRTGAGLIVLSGCYSAQGAALPGTGLRGLTRAWLTAGARAVVSSRWPTPDEDGPLFQALYRNLRTGRPADPGQALRTAQLEMIRSGGGHARPRYWGAFFVIGGP
jgi:CHAT domain-containing protein